MSSSTQRQQEVTIIHQLIARQLEYYFSTVNLAKDTYVSTLRSLNDGYVPVSIIANFGKVQALAPFDSALEAVQIAATEYSELLEVVHIDTDSGKKVEATSTKKKTVLAVGPVSGEAIPMEQISTTLGGTAGLLPPASATTTFADNPSSPASGKVSTTNSTSSVQNTVIIREAPEGTEEETIRSLFQFQDCPSIESVHLDLQNCW